MDQHLSPTARGEQLLGSSEIIESVLGKLKRLEQNQAKSGFIAPLGAIHSVPLTRSSTLRMSIDGACTDTPSRGDIVPVGTIHSVPLDALLSDTGPIDGACTDSTSRSDPGLVLSVAALVSS
jgi:hypothetical protein